MSNLMTAAISEDETETRKRGRVNKAFLRLTYAVSGRTEVKMLEKHQEVALLDGWLKNRCPAAIDQLLRSFDPLLVSMARRIASEQRCPHLLDDIYGAGIMAFIEGLDAFKIEEENRLSTFIRFRIAGAMMRICLDFRLPLRTGTTSDERKAFYRHRATIDAFEQTNGRAPSDTPADLAKISAGLGISPKVVKHAGHVATAKVVPIDDEDIIDESHSFDDIAAVREILKRTLEQTTSSLSTRDQQIFAAYVDNLDTGNKLTSLAATFDLTSERIGQIVRSILVKLRMSLNAQGYGQAADMILHPS
jgi:RNA polymerase sigma factor (sigma-70 family)